MSYTMKSIRTVTVGDLVAHTKACEEDGYRFADPECGWTWLVGGEHAMRVPKSMTTEDVAIGVAFAAGFPVINGQTLGSLVWTNMPRENLRVVTLPDDFMDRLYDADAHHGDALNIFDINGIVDDLIARRVSITYSAPVVDGIGPVGGHFEVDCLVKRDQRDAADLIFPSDNNPDSYGRDIELNIGRTASTFGVKLHGEDTRNLSIWRRMLSDHSFLGFGYNGVMLAFGEIGTAELTENRLTWTFTIRDLLKLEEHPRTPRTRHLRISAGVKGSKLPTGYAASLLHRLPGGVSHIETKVDEHGFREGCGFTITWTWPVFSEGQAVEIAKPAKVIIGESFVSPLAHYVTKPVASLSYGESIKHVT